MFLTVAFCFVVLCCIGFFLLCQLQKVYFKFRIAIQNRDCLARFLNCFGRFSSNFSDTQLVWLIFLIFGFDIFNRKFKIGSIFCVCGKWSSNETFQWEFYFDKNMTASFIHLEKDLKYEDLLNMVSKDFCIQEEDITLSYKTSLQVKSIVEDVHPAPQKILAN